MGVRDLGSAATADPVVLSASLAPKVAPTLTGPVGINSAAGSSGSGLSVQHFANGTGGSGGQTYGLEVHRYDGAKTALVIHDYDNGSNGPAIWVDQTNANQLLRLNNTFNNTINPGHTGTGNFIQFMTNGADLGAIDKDMKWHVLGGTNPVAFQSDVASVGAVSINGTQAAIALQINQTGAASAMQISCNNAGAAGQYAFKMDCRDYGPLITTNAANGNALTLVLQTGFSTGIQIQNKGSAPSIDCRSASASLFTITAAGLPQWSAAANQQTTVGAAGAASALPATPTKYLKVLDSAGTTYVIPAYAAV